ncbi:SURF1 family protein [Novosphingobium flavum]|uniref:SURF1-like protein n=1 Tax=Novosphingobium flavum TaxID=1778672 RepID=A0A7X1FRU8_9SPHN|nr:SURF1 family cytochrome oxidase biogenesis protein [Novosphingobium flavum]MBC2665800.1 SURF1 family protein [Novosphingobium flavum]
MTRRIPIIPTAIVLIAAAIMVRLGFWQLDRLAQKQDMLARFTAAEADRTVHPWPRGGIAPLGYTRLQLECRSAGPAQPEAGRSASGQSGWAQVVQCATPEGAKARIVLGWSSQPAPATWQGGAVTGTFVPKGEDVLVYADPPLAGLQPNARPDPRDIPNNHLAYAVQWFLFAAIAVIIYALALRKRLRG